MSNSVCKDELAAAAVKLWRGGDESLVFVSDSANPVYEFNSRAATFYLRLTSSKNRTKQQIEAELDFISYLRAGGVSVALPIAASDGQFIEEIHAGDELFFACVFPEANGARFRYADFSGAARKAHFRLRGSVLGQVHALSKNYVPAGNFRRFAWDEDVLLREAEKFLPASEKQVWQETKRLREVFRALPKSRENFGLIHGDFGETNYRCGDARLNVFDFDDSCYHWFAYDVAVSIYPHGWRAEGLPLLESLLEGYAENAPVNFTLEDITRFCHWRQIYMFLVYARKWGFTDLSPQQATWFAQKRENIARGYEWRR